MIGYIKDIQLNKEQNRFEFPSVLFFINYFLLCMHPTSSHKTRHNIFRESELNFCHFSNKYIFHLRRQKLGTFLLLRSMKEPLHM